MPVFDVSFLNEKSRKSSGSSYNTLVDQLSILQSQLEGDGKLAPGDYDYLISQGQKLLGVPGLTPDQRSNIQVKIAGYQKSKKTDTIKDTEGIDRLNRDVKDSVRQNITLLADKPNVLLQANADALQAKLTRLADSVNRLDSAGDDSSVHLNEYNSTLSELKDTLEALQDVEGYAGGAGKPGSQFVAYVTTNNKGEISDVEFGRVGKGGFVQTNGLYGGLQVYGKVNAKESGKNVFMMGNTRFTAPDNLLPGPDGSFTSSPLIAESSQKGKTFKTVSGTPYIDLDPTSLKSQSTIDPGGWAVGEKGTLYQRQQDGSYRKYMNVKPEQYETLGISSNNMFRVPRSLEQGIIPGVRETIDAAGGIKVPPAPLPQTGGISPTPTPTATPTPSPAGTPRTPSPTERAPSDAQSIASKVYSGAKGFLSNLFR